MLIHLMFLTAVAGDWTRVLDHGDMSGFPTYSQANSLLKEWVRKFPSLLAVREIGQSFESRPINAYILSAVVHSPDRLERTPKVLLTALTHAREPASLTVVLYFIGTMLEMYSNGNPQAVYALQSRAVWVIPFVNPDGYIANEHGVPRMIRKNRRPTCPRKRDTGVDLNRNFGYRWKRQFSACDEEYQGKAPFSEPETQAIQILCKEKMFKAAMNFHSYGSMLTHPYNAEMRPSLPPADQLIYNELAKEFGFGMFGPVYTLLGYTASGEADDWMYGVLGILSMSPEVGPESGGFWPKPDLIAGINSRNFDRTLHVVLKVGIQLGVSWTLLDPWSPLRQAIRVHTAGGEAHSHRVLQLVLKNHGLSDSAGVALNVALTTEASAAIAGLTPLVMDDEGRLATVNLVNRVWAFQTFPLPRRSARSFQLSFGPTLESETSHKFWICILEVTGYAAAGTDVWYDICHCLELVVLPPDSNQMKPPVEFVFSRKGFSGNTNDALCAAASALGHGPARVSQFYSSPLLNGTSPNKVAPGAAGAVKTGAGKSSMAATHIGIFLVTGIVVLFLCYMGRRRLTKRLESRGCNVDAVLPSRVPVSYADYSEGDVLQMTPVGPSLVAHDEESSDDEVRSDGKLV